MRTPRTIAEFCRWLRVEIDAMNDPEPDTNQYYEAADTIRKARRIAIALNRADVAEICRPVKTQALALTIAQEVLANCRAQLRKRRAAGLGNDGLLTPPQVAKRYGVSPDTVRGWITSGVLRAVNVGKGTRPRYRITADALKEFDAKRPARIAPKTPPQRRRRRKTDLPFTRYTSRPTASPERGPSPS